MPSYRFQCFDCKDSNGVGTVEIICSISERNNVIPGCPKCSKSMERCYAGGNIMIKGAPYSKPIHSDALAMNPEQVAEHREMFPSIPVDEQCRPVFTNSQDHQDYMNKCGVVKKEQKIKPQGEIIAVVGEDNGKEESGWDEEEEGGVHED